MSFHTALLVISFEQLRNILFLSSFLFPLFFLYPDYTQGQREIYFFHPLENYSSNGIISSQGVKMNENHIDSLKRVFFGFSAALQYEGLRYKRWLKNQAPFASQGALPRINTLCSVVF